MNEIETYNNALFIVDNDIGIYRAYDENGELETYEQLDLYNDALDVVSIFEKYPRTT